MAASKHRSPAVANSAIVVVLALLLSGCIVTQDSPAPGCVKSIGFPVMGGCFGKTAILDLAVEPETECLVITANNCNGGVLAVTNSCDEALVLGGVEIPPADRVSLDVREAAKGTYALSDAGGNFSEYIPEETVSVTLVGLLGVQETTVVFTKTAQLCE